MNDLSVICLIIFSVFQHMLESAISLSVWKRRGRSRAGINQLRRMQSHWVLYPQGPCKVPGFTLSRCLSAGRCRKGARAVQQRWVFSPWQGGGGWLPKSVVSYLNHCRLTWLGPRRHHHCSLGQGVAPLVPFAYITAMSGLGLAHQCSVSWGVGGGVVEEKYTGHH